MTDHNGVIHASGNRSFLPVTIRPYQPADFDAVLAIECDSFPYPWSRVKLSQCLREFGSNIAEADGQVVGFMVHTVYDYQLDLMDFAVAVEYRRRGVGRQMVDELKQLADSRELDEVNYLLNERNVTGQLFLKAVGFKSVVVLNGCGHDGDESMYLMRLLVE